MRPMMWDYQTVESGGEGAIENAARLGRLGWELIVVETAGWVFKRQDRLEWARQYRRERVERIQGGDTPVPLREGAKVLVHIVPLDLIDADEQSLHNESTLLFPLFTSSSSTRYSAEGLVTYAELPRETTAGAYLLLTRHGVVETVNATRLTLRDGARVIPSQVFERDLIDAIGGYFRQLQDMGASFPVLVFLSLLGAQGFAMAKPQKWWFVDEDRRITSDVLLFPEVQVNMPDADPSGVLRPMLDRLWNAAGWRGSPYYDEEGRWRPQ